MHNYRIFMQDGDYHDIFNVFCVEMINLDLTGVTKFLFIWDSNGEEKQTEYNLNDVKAFTVID